MTSSAKMMNGGELEAGLDLWRGEGSSSKSIKLESTYL